MQMSQWLDELIRSTGLDPIYLGWMVDLAIVLAIKSWRE
jgi:hypothetical protein